MRWIAWAAGLALVAVLLLRMTRDDPRERRATRREAPARQRGESRSGPGGPAEANGGAEATEAAEAERTDHERRRLVDASGAPIRGAVIQIETAAGWADAGRTDAEGRVVWNEEPGGAFVWRVIHPNVQALPMLREADGSGFDTLLAGIPFSVLVRNEEGEAVAGARVRLRYTGYHERADGRRDVDPPVELEQTTDEDGLAPFSALPDGSLNLHLDVVHPDFAPESIGRGYGGGARVDARLVVVLSRGGTVEGRVVDAQDRAVSGAIVTADGQRSVSDDQGRYRIVLGKHGAILRARKEGVGMGESGVVSARMPMPEAVRVPPGETRRGVDIRLFPVSRVTGRVAVQGLPTAEGVEVAYQVRKPGMNEWTTVRVGEDGAFSTEPFFVPIESEIRLRVGGGAVTTVERAVSVPPGRDVDAGEFLLALHGTVGGRVVDGAGEPIRGGVVQMANVRAPVDEEGRFVLRGVPTGRWSAAFYHWEEPSRAAALGAVVEIVAGGALEDYVIRADPRGVLVGRVVDERDRPVVGAQVAVAPVGIPGTVDTRKWGEFRTDDEGRFRAAELAPGRYAVAVVHLGSGMMQQFRMDELMTPVEVDVRSGESAVVVRMPPIGRIRARIESELGGDLAHANLTVHWLEPAPATGTPRLWLSRRSFGWTAVEEEFEEPVPEAGRAALSVSRDGHALWLSDPVTLHPRESVDLGTIRMGAGRALRLTVRDPDGSVPAKVSARVLPHPGPAYFPMGLAAGEYRDGLLTVEHAPARRLAVVLSSDAGAPVVVLVPASGPFDAQVRLAAPVAVTVRAESSSGDFLWVFDVDTGQLVSVAMTPPRGTLELDRLPARPLRFVLQGGAAREFEPRPGEANVVSFPGTGSSR